MTYFLDTNICIYAAKGQYPSLQQTWLSHSPSAIAVPAIVKAELLYGALKSRDPKRAIQTIRRLLDPYPVIAFDEACLPHYASVRSSLESIGQPIGPNDLLIASTALAHDAILVTHNSREFQRVPGLKTEDWTQ